MRKSKVVKEKKEGSLKISRLPNLNVYAFSRFARLLPAFHFRLFTFNCLVAHSHEIF